MQKLLLLVIVIPSILNAQKLNLELFGGFANYQGDLQEQRFTTNQSRGAFGIGARYNVTDHWAIRSHFSYAKLAASDKFNSDVLLRDRNLNFETKITELNLLVDYSLFSLNDKKLTPYVFAGVAAFHYNPYTFDSAGSKHFLKPLSTEGQGLSQYPDRKEYKLTQISIPFGLGVRWRVADNIVLGYEIGLRKTFTDYLDDVSSTYVDAAILAAER
ncbi:MAG: outer membrane beta-barrel protein, partial [Gemmatimonadaceae bacterium]|nr:outer membrane beta-barrel protein [Chitinophagaceae bacterium]